MGRGWALGPNRLVPYWVSTFTGSVVSPGYFTSAASGSSLVGWSLSWYKVGIVMRISWVRMKWNKKKNLEKCLAQSMCVCVLSHSVLSDSLQPHGQSSLVGYSPWGLSRQFYWSGLPCRPPGDLPNPGTEPRSPALQVNFLPSGPPQKPASYWARSQNLLWFQRLLFPNSMPLPFFKMWENLDLMDLD